MTVYVLCSVIRRPTEPDVELHPPRRDPPEGRKWLSGTDWYVSQMTTYLSETGLPVTNVLWGRATESV